MIKSLLTHTPHANAAPLKGIDLCFLLRNSRFLGIPTLWTRRLALKQFSGCRGLGWPQQFSKNKKALSFRFETPKP